MDSYKYMFNNCRIPKKPADVEVAFDPVKNNHVIAIRKNKFYVIDTVHNGRQLSTNELQKQFERVIEAAGNDKGLPLGVLTAENRDKWTEVIDYSLRLCDFEKKLKAIYIYSTGMLFWLSAQRTRQYWKRSSRRRLSCAWTMPLP